MDINEQIKSAENLLKFTQDYLGVKKLNKTMKTGEAKKNLEKVASELANSIKKETEVL